MITRRSLTVLIFIVALCIPATASGKASMQLMLSVNNGTKSSKRVSATVTFPVPKKSTAAKACKGKITFSVPIGKKTVKKKKRTVYSVKKSSLKTVNGACSASADLKVPDALLGKTLKFTAVFKGNGAAKKFKTSKKFLFVIPPVVIPPAPFKPTAGPWTIRQTPDIGSGNLSSAMTITADGSATNLIRSSGMTLNCGPNEVFIPSDDSPFDTVFNIASTSVTATDEWENPANALAHTTSTFVLNFDRPDHATGTFRLTGSVLYASGVAAIPIVYTGCDTGLINVDLAPGIFA